MTPGAPVRVYGGRKVCKVARLIETKEGSENLGWCARICVAAVLWRGLRSHKCGDVHTGRAATHRQDGTAYPLCKVCWPDGEVG